MKSRTRGFTLLEVLIALIMLTLGAVGIFRALFGVMSTATMLEHRLHADFLLDRATEEMRIIVNTDDITGEYIYTSADEDPPVYSMTGKINHLAMSGRVYVIESAVTWPERGVPMAVRRVLYVRKEE